MKEMDKLLMSSLSKRSAAWFEVRSSGALFGQYNASLAVTRFWNELQFTVVRLLVAGITLGRFVAVAAYREQLTDAIKGTFDVWSRWRILQPNRDECNELLGNPPAVSMKELATPSELKLVGVSFRYGTNEQPVFRDVSLTIPAGVRRTAPTAVASASFGWNSETLASGRGHGEPGCRPG